MSKENAVGKKAAIKELGTVRNLKPEQERVKLQRDKAVAKLKKIVDWLLMCASKDRDFADTCRFDSLKASALRDARNFEATADDLKRCIKECQE